jgi:hypothetical protein
MPSRLVCLHTLMYLSPDSAQGAHSSREERVGLFEQAKIAQCSEADVRAGNGRVHRGHQRGHPRHARNALLVLDDCGANRGTIRSELNAIAIQPHTMCLPLKITMCLFAHCLRIPRTRRWAPTRALTQERCSTLCLYSSLSSNTVLNHISANAPPPSVSFSSA